MSLFGGDAILGYLLAGLVGLISIIVAFLRGSVSGASKERAKNQKEQLDAFEQEMRDIGNAASAGRGRLPDAATDKYNRDTRG